MKKSGKVITLKESEYICGVIAAEMPVQYDVEAIKAQAVACYTYAFTKRQNERMNPDISLKGADITDSPETHQGYIGPEQSKEKWGVHYDENRKKVEEAVKDVLGQLIIYDGKPILAAYHCISSGMTESAEIIWNEKIPYLKSVKSVGDMISPEYKTIVSIPEKEFSKIIHEETEIKLGDDPNKCIGDVKITEAGTVLEMKVGSEILSGLTIRKLFNLRSPCFTVKYENETFDFTVKGYGHGVGMSQYGADYMARQGKDYVDILKHYYSGIDIVLKQDI